MVDGKSDDVLAFDLDRLLIVFGGQSKDDKLLFSEIDNAISHDVITHELIGEVIINGLFY